MPSALEPEIISGFSGKIPARGDFVHAAYACLPVLNGAGAPVADSGRELVIVTRVQSGDATERERDRMLARTYRAVIPAVVDGRVP